MLRYLSGTVARQNKRKYWVYREDVRWTTRTKALVATGVVAVLIAACGNGSPAAVHHGPTAIPVPGSKIDSSALCRTYFGSPATVANEFGVASLKLTHSGPERLRSYNACYCYYNNGLLFTMTTHGWSSQNNYGVWASDGKSGNVYVYASMVMPPHIPQNIHAWLRSAAARAKPSK